MKTIKIELTVTGKQANFLFGAVGREIREISARREAGWEERVAYLEELASQIAGQIKASEE